jgi:polysaccharide pyruvyl transferase WcaK-like protein
VQTLDFAFFYPFQRKLVRSRRGVKTICLCLAQPWKENEREANYRLRYEKLCCEIRSILNNCFPSEYEFYFVPFHDLSDVQFAEDVLRGDEYLNSRAKVVSTETSMLDKIDYIIESDFIFSMRFHSSVLSIILEKPFVAISYDFKISSLLKRFNLTNFEEIGLRNNEFFQKEFDCDFLKLEQKVRQNIYSSLNLDNSESIPDERAKFLELVELFRRIE